MPKTIHFSLPVTVFIQLVNIQLPMMTERTYIYINDLAVSEKYRNNGVASLLLKHIEVMAREMGAAKIELAVIHSFIVSVVLPSISGK